jgi:malate dehydrogenase
MMVRAVIQGGGYAWPCGTYVDSEELGFHNVMMAMETTLDNDGVHWQVPTGTDEEMAALRASYDHLVKLRDEVIEMGVLPPTADWEHLVPSFA